MAAVTLTHAFALLCVLGVLCGQKSVSTQCLEAFSVGAASAAIFRRRSPQEIADSVGSHRIAVCEPRCRQPTTDNRQPTIDNRQPTTDNRQPSTHPPSADHALLVAGHPHAHPAVLDPLANARAEAAAGGDLHPFVDADGGFGARYPTQHQGQRVRIGENFRGPAADLGSVPVNLAVAKGRGIDASLAATSAQRYTLVCR
jgi:hypothetical protein